MGTRNQVQIQVADFSKRYQILGLTGIQNQKIEAQIGWPMAHQKKASQDSNAMHVDRQVRTIKDLHGY